MGYPPKAPPTPPPIQPQFLPPAAPPSAPQQLDIFADSQDVMLRNDVVQALQGQHAKAAQQAWQRLDQDYPQDLALAPLALLIQALAQLPGKPLPDLAALAGERQALRHRTAPAAAAVFGPLDAKRWLAPLWRSIAQRSAHLVFQGTHADDHAAPLWLLAGDWTAAAQAVAGIESWRRIPAPLAWMTEARYRLGGLDGRDAINGPEGLPGHAAGAAPHDHYPAGAAPHDHRPAWPLLAELAWLAPERFDTLQRQLGDPLLARLRRRFDAGFDGIGDASDLAWFPAWVLTDTPALAHLLGLTQPSLHNAPERGMRLLLDLLALERQGRHHDLVARRKTLRDLCAPLYAAYMASR